VLVTDATSFSEPTMFDACGTVTNPVRSLRSASNWSMSSKPVSGSVRPLLDRAPDPLGRASDGTGVRLVVLVGDDHLVAGLEDVGEGVGEHVGVRRRRRSEHHFTRLDAERFGPPRSRERSISSPARRDDSNSLYGCTLRSV
jgi:hypothetical protein